MKWIAGILLVLIVAEPGQDVKQEIKPESINKELLPGMTFVHIPGGSFQMGSNDGGSDEKPVHLVTLGSFQIMTTEVTQAMWKEVMGNNPSYWKGDDMPVRRLSWDDCQEFIRKLNQRDPGKGYRLPTEAEWEYACRAGTTTKYYSGNSESDLERIAWYKGNSGDRTHPVGQKEPNAWGLYDMLGNAWEWCEDSWHDNYEGAPNDGSAWISGSSSYRVLRGGFWCGSSRACQSTSRGRVKAVLCCSGFRLVRAD